MVAGEGCRGRVIIQLDVMQPLPAAGLLREDWPTQFPNNSVVVESVCALVTRKGNPKNINGWDDLGEAPFGSKCRPRTHACVAVAGQEQQARTTGAGNT